MLQKIDNIFLFLWWSRGAPNGQVSFGSTKGGGSESWPCPMWRTVPDSHTLVIRYLGCHPTQNRVRHGWLLSKI